MPPETTPSSSFSRREMLKTSGQVAAGGALASLALPAGAYAGEDNTIQLALIGCGGRGTGAAVNALSRKEGPTKLVAMVDVQPSHLEQAHKILTKGFSKQVDVPKERQFIGFDGFKKAMDLLEPGKDVAMLTTPPAFRWPMFTYAIERGLNVFMEKPCSVDGPTSKRMFELAKKADEKNLKVGVGLMCRHSYARQELFDRIRDGALGNVNMLRAYRVQPPIANCFVKRMPKGENELLWQIKYFHAFLWPGGGSFSDFFIHNIDECCWMKDSFPISAKGYGGRHYEFDNVDQNFDSYTVEYTFPDGAKLWLEGRNMAGCDNQFASYVHGGKGAATISAAGHWPAHTKIYEGQDVQNGKVVWEYGKEEHNPYDVEWEDLFHAIRQDKPYNEAHRGVEASLVTAMGRMSCHTGKTVTRDEILNFNHEFAPGVDSLTFDSPAPLASDENGRYPIPAPGLKSREY